MEPMPACERLRGPDEALKADGTSRIILTPIEEHAQQHNHKQLHRAQRQKKKPPCDKEEMLDHALV